jgi:hypothetical protein
MSAVAREVLQILAHIGATIRPAGDRLILQAGDVPVPPDIVARVRAAKSELLALLTAPEPSFEHPCAARRGRIVEGADQLFLHFCCECGAWAPFGYGVSLREGRLGRWYCAAHRPTGAALRAR